ncbi:MAG: methyltransferase domain-containing protein [Candidatus Marinimicrobia bacterium]|nr:methyltransferase domain-containing protein [Candidatus Neomarinimicrobiota bacterium]
MEIIVPSIVGVFLLYLVLAHYVSYTLRKKQILNEHKWDLNICCGKTDGGGLNVDIIKHQELPRFIQIDDIYDLPFADHEFDSVLCSHTMEHVDDPRRFYAELQRVGKHITVVVPPLYDLAAVFDILEHKWIFLTFKKRHHALPKFVKVPFADLLHRLLGQKNYT